MMSHKYRIKRERLLTMACEDLACYAAAVWPRFELAKHHGLIISKLEAVERGEISRLMIFLPPRHGKSLIGSAIFPAWYLGKHPDREVLLASYGQELSGDFGRRVRNLVAQPLHNDIFPNFRLSKDSTAAHRFNTTKGGAYYAVGREGAITGRGADLLLLDDPIKNSEAVNSATIRKSLQEWFATVAYTRLMPGGAIVLIQTRWHQDDLAGWLMREHAADNWQVLSLPAIAEQDESFRQKGEALWPEKFPLADLERKRAAIGGRAWISLYQQRPAAVEGVVFKREWWQFYRLPLTVAWNRIIMSWDTAFKKGTENDFSVCTTWGVADHGYYLLHVWRGRVEFPELKRKLTSLAEHWKPNAILVEDRASGQSLIQELKSSTALPIIPVKVDSDKQSRAQAITPLMEAGKIFLPETAPWVSDFVEEMACFPNGIYDDVVDSTTQALNYLRVEPPLAPISLGYSMFGPNSGELDKEEIWEKAMSGYEITWDEFERM